MEAKQAAQQELMRRKARAEIERRAGGQPQQAPQMQEAQPQEARWDHKVGAAIDGVAQGLTFGYSDEIAAGMASGGGLWGDYDEELTAERGRMQENKDLAGGYELGGNIAGSIAGAGGLLKSGVTMMRGAPTVGKAAMEGAAYGAAHGSGQAVEGERLEGAGVGALTGAATGGAFQKVGNVVASKVANRAAKAAAPTVDQVKQQSSALYTQMRESGLTVREGAINKIKSNIKIGLGQTTKDLAPKAHSLQELVERDLTGAVNIIDLHNVSKAVNRISRTNLEGDDKFFVAKIKTFVDNAIDGMTNADVKGPLEALKLKGEADKLWKTARKSELVEDMFEKAQNQATGFENGIVIQFRSLANNKKKMAQFTKEEQDMVRDLVRRGSGRAILKGLGMLSPTSTFGGLMAGGVGVGSGVLPAAAMAGVGYGARKSAEAMTRGKADAIKTAVLTGNAPKKIQAKRLPIGGAASIAENQRSSIANGTQNKRQLTR